MSVRTTLTDTTRKARMGTARATIREFDDDHLMQQVKKADVYHSETPSDFERWQPVGMTAFPIKQQEDENKKSPAPKSAPEDGDWNHDQPTGPAAEAVMLYIGGSRSHPVAMVDDRRVRPYGMSEGEGAHYAPDGSEQMVLFKENGTYIVGLDGPSVKDKKEKKTRMVSLRHVSKKMQTHKIEKKQDGGGGSGGGSGPSAQQLAAGSTGGGQQQEEKYKHEGDSVNTEVRCTKDRIEFRAGDTVFGYFEASTQTWYLKGKIAQMEFTDKISEKVGSSEIEIKPVIVNVDSQDVNIGKKTWIGQDAKDKKEGPKVMTEEGETDRAHAKKA
jgi:phage gp45-like